jgi:hypothetical protein
MACRMSNLFLTIRFLYALSENVKLFNLKFPEFVFSLLFKCPQPYRRPMGCGKLLNQMIIKKTTSIYINYFCEITLSYVQRVIRFSEDRNM